VDPVWYRETYSDLRETPIDVAKHYLDHGAREGRNPSPLFDTYFYIGQIDQANLKNLNPLVHYIKFGAADGVDPHSLFCTTFYVSAAGERINTDINPLMHYYTIGWRLGLNSTPLFDAQHYASNYRGNIDTNVDPMIHFMSTGWKHNADPHPLFDVRYYMSQRPLDYISEKLLPPAFDPLSHYMDSGWKQGFRPNPDFPDFSSSGEINISRACFLKNISDFILEYDKQIFSISESRLNCNKDDKSGNPFLPQRKIEEKYNIIFSSAIYYIKDIRPLTEVCSGAYVIQYFLISNTTMRSISAKFFTYNKLNGADITIKLSIYDNNLDDFRTIFISKPERRLITDGGDFTIWLERPIEVEDKILASYSVFVDNIDKGSQFTLAIDAPQFPGIFVQDGKARNDVSMCLYLNKGISPNANKMFAFISGCPGDAFRYRCQHQAETLRMAGYTADVFPAGDFPFETILQNYSVVIAHRVAHDDAFERFLSMAAERDILVSYDTDDLVFDPNRIDQIDGYKLLPKIEQEIYRNGVIRYRRSLELIKVVSVSTEKLADEVRHIWPDKHIFVLRNVVSQFMVDSASESYSKKNNHVNKLVQIAYFSGTKTHERDFKTCSSALRRILEQFDNVKVVIVGHLNIPKELEMFSNRIRKIPFVEWAKLPEIYKNVDINLAPLEYDNDFTASKSELKYLEAALLAIPTVASNVGAYSHVIRNWTTGVLCASEAEWTISLKQLVEDPALRKRIGDAARTDVTNNCTTRGTVEKAYQVWLDLKVERSRLGNFSKFKSIAFVVRAPIAVIGGGYKKIFTLACDLIKKGYVVRVYVEAIAHLEGKSDVYIRSFCRDNFGIDESAIVVGHDKIDAVDVAVATNWPTAPTVAGLQCAKVLTYFVQDYEPEFYEQGTLEAQLAENTYNLDLSLISIGEYLQFRLHKAGRRVKSIPFSIDSIFHNIGKKKARGTDNVRKSVRVLFFARPDIPRRNFEAGVEGIGLLFEKHGKAISVALYGMDSQRKLPFPYEHLGRLNQSDLATQMVQSDIHLSFSMSNISTVIYEAMACGCACVEADVPSVRAMVRHRTNCILAEPDGAGTFRALDELVTNAELRYELSCNAYESVSSMTSEQMANVFETRLQEFWIN
jgi:glycosyltransferase involved in cell wall biosynthesis